MNDKVEPDLSQKVAGIAYRSLVWARDHVPPGVRSILGLLLMVGGVLGFLPVLGFWMLPLGVAFIALDLPFARNWLEHRIEQLRIKSLGPASQHTSDSAPDSGPTANDKTID